MTCIIAIEQNGIVTMGGDRMGSNGYTGAPVAESKVFKKGGVLIGYTSSFRMGQLLQHALTIPVLPAEIDLDKWVAIDFMQAIRQVYQDNGWDGQKDNKAEHGSFLMAVNGRCYEIQSDYSFIRNLSGEYAVGSGTSFALGSLRSTRGKLSAEKRILEGLETASEYVVTVQGPYDVLVCKAGKKEKEN